MKNLFLLLFLLSLTLPAQEDSNYTIMINGEDFSYNLGDEFTYDVKKKGPLSIKIFQNEMLTFNDGIVRFSHSKNFPVSETEIEDGIKQISAIGSTGIGVIIQEYQGIDPSFMLDLMLNEVTKESKEYGYEETQTPFELTLKDGKHLKGKKSLLEYQGSIDEWSILSYSWKDAGVLIITMSVDENNMHSGNNFIQDFLDSLEILVD